MAQTRKTNGRKKNQKTNTKRTSSRTTKTTKAETRKRSSMKKKRLAIAGVAAAAVLVVFLCVYFSLKSVVDKVPADTICNNIYIDSVDVSGMKTEEAKAAVQQKVDECKALTVELTAEEAIAQVTLAELGFDAKELDKLVEEAVSYGKSGSIWSRYSKISALEDEKQVFEMTYAIDSEMIAATIENKIPELENAAKDAEITRKNGQFVITDAEKGVAIDAEESVKAIETYLNQNWKQESCTIELVTKVEEPEVTREELEQIQNVLGKFTTYCGTGGGRVQNIVTGTKLINGSVIMPGEEFSADAAMRPYTFDNGYAEAGSYENGKVVQSMGGGICQVSSTLYNACILAELEITQRQAHSMTVGYVEASMDAAIAGDYKDLKFKNNTEAPIYLEGYVSGGYITFVVYGKETRDANRTIKYISETLSTTPPEKKFVASNAAIGTKSTTDSGHTGKKAQLWKVVYIDGKEVSREIFNTSSYISSAATISVGTSSSSTAATKVVTNAIATQNEDKINAAIQEAKDIIAKEQAAAQQPSTPSTPSTPETTPGENQGGETGSEAETQAAE